MEEIFICSKETQRALRLQDVKSGVITLKKASSLLSLSKLEKIPSFREGYFNKSLLDDKIICT